MNMNAPLIALASILFAASVSAEQDPFTTPTRGEVKKTSIEPPRPERNIARIPRAITYSKNKNGQNVYKLTGLYSHSDEKNDASHAAYYKMLIPKCTGISMDRALGTCIITTSRKLSNSELAYAIDDMAESGDEIPYWRELEARDIPKSKAFSKTTYTIAPYQRGLPPDLAWFGVDDTMTPVPLGLRSEVGSLLIVPTTAYCMDYSRFALRVLLRAEQKWTELNRAKVDFFTNRRIALAGPYSLFLVGLTAGTDRALLESNPSSLDGAIGDQNGDRALGKGRLPQSHSLPTPFAPIRQTPGFGAAPQIRSLAMGSGASNARMKTNNCSTDCPSRSSRKPSPSSTTGNCPRRPPVSGSASAAHASIPSKPSGWPEAATSRWHHREAITHPLGLMRRRHFCASLSPQVSPPTSASWPTNSTAASPSNAPLPTFAIMSANTCQSCCANRSNAAQSRAADGSARAMAICSNTTVHPTSGGPEKTSRSSP